MRSMTRSDHLIDQHIGAGEVSFHGPVSVGSFLNLEARVVCTEGDSVLVKVLAKVVERATSVSVYSCLT
jgi:acyl-CoA hydrolase